MPDAPPPPKKQTDDRSLSFWEHLDELRARLIRGVVAYVAGVTVVWTFRDPILAWLWKPFADSWREQKIQGDPALHFAAPSDIFAAYLKLSMIGGLLVAAPFIFWQLWMFIAPGLYAKEKKFVLPFVVSSSVLFVGGGLFGWRVAFPITFGYFLELAGSATGAGIQMQPVVMIPEYLDFVGQMLLAFGLVFELPLLILFLSMAGIVNWLQLWNFGRWFILVAFTVGAIVTPPDTTSQLVMSIPLCLLYFVSIGLAWMFGKRPSPEEIAAHRARQATLKAERAAWRAEKRRLESEERAAKAAARDKR